jgi:AraC family transcriptional regulator, transcriptional activator of pobA
MVTSRAHRRTAAAPAPIPAFSLYGEPPRPPDEGTLHVEMISTRSRPHGWHIAAHRHSDLHQILIVHRGCGNAVLDGRGASFRAPAAIVIPPGSVHAFAFEEGTEGLVLSFAIGIASDLSGRAPGLLELLVRPSVLKLNRRVAAAAQIDRLGVMLLREFERPAAGRVLALRGLLGALVANVLRATAPQAIGSGVRVADQRELVARFRQAIEQRYREHATIAAYARALEVSERRLQRACAAILGQRPVELVHLRLLLEAERQLRYTSLSVAEVAYRCGFDDPAYFTRFFTRRAKMSPRAFRRHDSASAASFPQARRPRPESGAAGHSAQGSDTSRGAA